MVTAAAANNPYDTFGERLTTSTCTIEYTAVNTASLSTTLTPANKALYTVIVVAKFPPSVVGAVPGYDAGGDGGLD
jgi:hypothetical protein